jgi:deoxyribose-phosphate aldolase
LIFGPRFGVASRFEISIGLLDAHPMIDLARRIELMLVRPDTTRADVAQLCQQARELNACGICVVPDRVEQTLAQLEDTEIKIVALVGFPLGSTDTDTKRFETETAVDFGAQEIEIALNVGRLKDGDQDRVLRELRDIVEAADERPVRLALESRLLTREEIVTACHLALDAGVAGVANSTGRNGFAADAEDVRLLCEAIGQKHFVKATGQITSTAEAQALINAGADRLGLTDASFLGPMDLHARR